jgi:hypothetical protein
LSRDVIAMIGGDIRLSCHIQNLQNKTVGSTYLALYPATLSP